MNTPQEISNRRVNVDIKELDSIRCAAIQWETPCDSANRNLFITFRIRSIDRLDQYGNPVYRDEHRVVVEIPPSYPIGSPVARMASGCTPIFHPNFYPSGLVCTQTAKWSPNETLAVFVLRLAKMFQFDPVITDPNNPANKTAATWYKAQLTTNMFPTDFQKLPSYSDDEDDFSVGSVY